MVFWKSEGENAEVGKLLGIDDYLPVTNTRRLFWSMNFMAGFEF